MSHNPYSAPSTSVADFDHAAALIRPRVATLGIAIFWLMMIIGAIGTVVSMFLSPELRSLPQEIPLGVMRAMALGFTAIVYAVIFWILKATGNGKNWGRVTLTVFVGLTVLVALLGWEELAPLDSAEHVLYLVQVVCEVGAMVLLYLPASNAWYAAKRAARA